MTPQDLDARASGAEQREVRRGDVLVRQRTPSGVLCFVVSGRFAVRADGRADPIAEIGQSELIGEIGFFAGLPCTATVVALRASTALAIGLGHFQQVGQPRPASAMR